MSLRYMSRVGARAAQAVREGAGRSVKDKAQSATTSTSSAAARSRAPAAGSVEKGRVSAAAARRAEEEKRRKAEHSLRTVMFLSVWGPNT
ncbi:hypothetical protein E2562_004337 [Oryza meyeriana var. granulata]|uniref:Uncharacterized protein n=1 Tax=Oryza meyeriana var. granulata TaxID=110450 RepID=A0A6G1BTW9_9ORYZ|nr:hypothetical protein E2562_004337 [Oryza meyeriana var. granulata]